MGRRYFFILVFIVYELSGYLSNNIYAPAMLSIAQDLLCSIDQVQLSIGAWLIGNGVAHIFLGPLSDRFGRKAVLLWGGGIYVLTLLGCSLSLSIDEFLFFRLVQGMSVASIMVAGYATIHETFSDREATTILGLTGATAILAPMLGPLLGALVLELYSWRAIFAALCTPTVALLIALAFITPQKHRPHAQHNLWRSFADYGNLFMQGRFMLLAIAYGCQLGCLMLWTTSSPYLLMKIGGLSERVYSLWQVPIFLALALGASSVRVLGHKFTRWHFAMAGQAIMVVGAGSFMLAATLATRSEILVLALLPLSTGFGIMSTSLVRSALTASNLDQGLITAGFFLIIDLISGGACLAIAALYETAILLSLCFLILTITGFTLTAFFKRTGSIGGLPPQSLNRS